MVRAAIGRGGRGPRSRALCAPFVLLASLVLFGAASCGDDALTMATLAWVFALAFLPVLGALVY